MCKSLIGWSLRRRLLLGLLLLSASSVPTRSQSPQTVEVMPVAVIDVSPKHEFVGRVEAINSVDLRARIEGFVEERLFNEGSTVQKGQPLFSIERRSYELALEDAQAGLASAKASVADAERRLRRNQTLSSQTVPRSVLEESETALDTARANLLAAETRVSRAELNLSYTTIRSPIEGRIGVAAVSIGSLVNPGSGPIARVVETDPIRVVFSVSDRTILDTRDAAGGLSNEQLAKEFATTLRLSNGRDYDQAGQIEFVDNQVDQQTGTLAVRAMFANPESMLIPGQFVTVIVGEREAKLRPVVPIGAVQQDREGKFVMLADTTNRAVIRRITVSDQVAGSWVVENGLSGGERLITGKLQSVVPDSTVEVVPVSGPTATPLSPGDGSAP